MPDQDLVLSILVTTYNLEKVITKTLDSIKSQKLNCSYEILVGDDGSTDHTIEKVKSHVSFKQGVVSIYELKHDSNDKTPAIVRASHNRINLAKHARGKYLVYLDGDDFFINSKSLQDKINILEKKENYDCVMCGSNFSFYNEETNESKLALPGEINRKKWKAKEYWKSGVWIHAEAFVIRNVINFNHIDDEWLNSNLFDDNLIVFSYLKHGDIYYINANDLCYRQNEEGFLKSSQEKQLFVNCLLYAHSNYFISHRDSELRCYSVIKELYKNKTKISEKYFASIPEYGCTVSETEKLLAYWSSKSFNRAISWYLLKINYIFEKIYSYFYYFGFQKACNKILRKRNSKII